MGLLSGWTIVSDIDGTLLQNGTMCPTNESKEAIKNWRDAGGVFVLASGRYLESTLKVYRELDLDTPVIYNNGACVYLPKKNEFLSLKELGPAIEPLITDILDTIPYCGVAGYSKDAIYSLRENPSLLRHYERQKITPLRTDTYAHFCKILLAVESDKMTALKEALAQKPYFNQFQFAQSTPEFYEITDIGVTKACQLGLLCSLFNCSKEKLITVGDNENDITLLKYGGVSFAVANATDGAKKAAQFVTATRGDSGSAIAEVIGHMTNQIKRRKENG